jgi:4-hydroxybenzoate polyprenyltransferase
MLRSLPFLLKTSRPGLWFPTVWLYLLPLAGAPLPLRSAAFWVGLVAVTFPLNLVVYGWNDRVDRETDRINPRKDSWLFGARGTDAQLDRLPAAMAAIGLSTLGVLVALSGPAVLGVGAAIAAFCWAYNHPTAGLRGRPPGDLLCQAGYLLVVALSCQVNAAPAPALGSWLYLGLFCAQAQLIGEVMDITPDRAAGRATTATVLGSRRARSLIIGVVSAEIGVVAVHFRDPVFAGGLALLLAWLVLDRLVLFPQGDYQPWQMKALGVLGNVAAVGSIVYVQATGLFAG